MYTGKNFLPHLVSIMIVTEPFFFFLMPKEWVFSDPLIRQQDKCLSITSFSTGSQIALEACNQKDGRQVTAPILIPLLSHRGVRTSVQLMGMNTVLSKCVKVLSASTSPSLMCFISTDVWDCLWPEREGEGICSAWALGTVVSSSTVTPPHHSMETLMFSKVGSQMKNSISEE